MKVLDTYTMGDLSLKNRMVMAPMTRSRATDHIPNELMATYYGQRAGTGLLITEGTAPSPNGIGYARIPGIYSADQIEGWKKTTKAVHDNGGKIFVQLMHTGRVSHADNMPDGATIMAPSAVQLDGKMYTDQNGEQPYPTPKAMEGLDIAQAIEEYVQAARNAISAGFDGVEIHAANGYLIDQFINPITNQRDDEYGGNIENRNRFAIEVAKGIVAAIGAERTGIRISPYGAMNGLGEFDGAQEAFSQLAKAMDDLGLVYLHTLDHSAMGMPEVPSAMKQKLRSVFSRTLILCGGFDKERAMDTLKDDKGDLIAFGRPFIANPDLPKRFKESLALSEPDQDTFYTPGAKGYTDYDFA